MLIEFKCPHCHAPLKAAADFAGKNAVCPHCKKQISVPKESEKSQDKTEEAARKE